MDNLKDVLLSPNVLKFSGAIIALLWFLGKIPISKQKCLRDNIWWRKILPLLPLVLGVGFAFAPGVSGIESEEWGDIIVFGLWTGFVAIQGRKVLKRWIVDKLGESK